jgi:4-hydroxyphenylpyruvate dioxygenase
MSAFDKFKRVNPMSDKINALAFHHLEFYSGDATSSSKRFIGSMGVELAAKSDLSTGNDVFSSYVMQTGSCRMVFTAAYHSVDKEAGANTPFPGYNPSKASAFFAKHGLAGYAIAWTVENVQETFDTMVANGGRPVLAPVTVTDVNPERGSCVLAEVSLYGDVVIRLVDARNFTGNFLPNYQDVVAPGTKLGKYGIDRIDHIVGNVFKLQDTLNYIRNMTVRDLPLSLLAFACSLHGLNSPVHSSQY